MKTDLDLPFSVRFQHIINKLVNTDADYETMNSNDITFEPWAT